MLTITKINAVGLMLITACIAVLGTSLIEAGLAYINVGFGLHPMLVSFILLVLMFLMAGLFVFAYEETAP